MTPKRHDEVPAVPPDATEWELLAAAVEAAEARIAASTSLLAEAARTLRLESEACAAAPLPTTERELLAALLEEVRALRRDTAAIAAALPGGLLK